MAKWSIVPGDLQVGRVGRTADRTAVSIRIQRLREGPAYSAALLLAPDEVRLRHVRRLLSGMPFICFLALDRDAARVSAERRIWRAPSGKAVLSLKEVLTLMRPEGRWAVERAPQRSITPSPLAADRVEREPDWLLPARVKPTEKRSLDLVGDWPWIRADHLGSLLGVERRRVSQLTAAWSGANSSRLIGSRANADSSSVTADWPCSRAAFAPFSWRNLRGRRTRQLLRHLTHTDAVHGFLASLANQGRSKGWRVTQLDPPHRASRYFRLDDRIYSVQPDAFGVLSCDGREQPFFLEWERRAIRPSTMARKLAPYLRYYSSKRPLEDHGASPLVLVAFDDLLAADHFLRVARAEQERTGVTLPLRVSDREALVEHGPLGSAWRTSDGRTAGSVID